MKMVYERGCLLLGRGGREGAVELCRGCGGSGTQVHIQQLLPGFIQQIQSMCHECQGQGERINPRDRCKNCQGRKIARERKTLDVPIDVGMLTDSFLLTAQSQFKIRLLCVQVNLLSLSHFLIQSLATAREHSHLLVCHRGVPRQKEAEHVFTCI